MNAPRVAATGSKSDANRWRSVSFGYDLGGFLDFRTIAELALLVMTVGDAGSARDGPQ
jgi:hypothetical protein